MFNDKAKWNPIELRQGDVLAGVPFPFTSVLQHHFLGGLNVNGPRDFPQLVANMHGLSSESNDQTFFTGQVAMKLSFCAVMTQCCELVCNAKGKLKFVQAVSLCRLIPLTAAMRSSQEKLMAIQTNPDIRKGQGYKNYFYYGAPAELGGKEELMADFSQTTCVPSREFPEALSLRVLQLDDRTRMKFKLKLGFFNASPTDEEIAQGIQEDPWIESKKGEAPAVEQAATAVVDKKEAEGKT